MILLSDKHDNAHVREFYSKTANGILQSTIDVKLYELVEAFNVAFEVA